MRRKNPVELVVTAPSKGVITYVPSNQPEKDSGRAATFAKNVRFARGVASSAPGCVSIALTGDALDSAITMVVQPGLASDFQAFTGFSIIIGTGYNLYQGLLSGNFAADGTTPVLSMALTRIYSGVQGFLPWRAAAFFDKAVVANGAVTPQWWNGSFEALPIPGLPQNYFPDGCENIANHLIFWKGRRGHWGDHGDYSLYIPVRDPACTGRWKSVHAVTIQVVDQITDWIYLDASTAKMAKGQFFRIDDMLNGRAAYFDVYDLSPVDSSGQMTTANFAQTVNGDTALPGLFVPATPSRIYLDNLNGVFPSGVHVQRDGGDWAQVLQVDQSSRPIQTALYTQLANQINPDGGTYQAVTFLAPAVGGLQNMLVINPSVFAVGDTISFCSTGPLTCTDIYTVMSIDPKHFYISVRREGLGTSQQSSYPNGSYVTFQPWVSLKRAPQPSATGAIPTVSVPALSVLRPVYGARFHSIDKTGNIPPGTSYIPYGVEFEALGTNTAGEFIQAGGSDEQGDILQIIRVNTNDGLMLKERAVYSIKFVGRPEIFNLKDELTDEGVIDVGAWCRLANNTISFLGHRGWYIYTAGGGVKPIAESYMRTLYEELDRTAQNRIRIVHDENQRELHLYYPTLNADGTPGPEKVLVYNYVEESVAFDDYTPLAVRTAGTARWEIWENWNSDSFPYPWTSFIKTWATPDAAFALPLINIVAYSQNAADFTGTGAQLFAYGFGNDRAGVAFHKEWQTIDFDFGDSSSFKYLDTCALALEIKRVVGAARLLWVQAGARDSLDAQIRWGTAVPIDCSGNRTNRPRVNLRRSGRFLRLKFYSDDVDTSWRISEFKLVARLGGTV